MSIGEDLYKRVIFDHNKSPRNFHEMDAATHECEGVNPLCGDKVKLFLNVDDVGVIEDISFTGSGCAIFKSSASMMTAQVKGRTIVEAKELFEQFHKMAKGELDTDKDSHSLGKLAVFSGVREYPSRIKCATLAWHTMICALEKESVVTTE